MENISSACATKLETKQEKQNCVVQTKEGPVRGYIEEIDDKIYYKFKSIPYAKPPLGDLRFLPPFPIKPWSEEIDCTKDAPCAMTYSLQGIVGSEDCLYIHVSTSSLDPQKRLPVMFWIGSHAHSCHSKEFIDPILINKQDIIFVRCGYRIGLFGFLSVNDFVAPGNCGLKDIVLALKWVKKNIVNFGGDPDNVTLFGSGGPIIHLMIMSPLASGLFDKAIIQSATALNNWVITKNPTEAVMELAKELEITTEDYKDIVEKIRQLPGLTIIEAFKNISHSLGPKERGLAATIFRPCIENEIEGQAAFLAQTPYSILKSRTFNKVALIIGSTNIAHYSIAPYIKDEFNVNFQKFENELPFLVPKSFCYETHSAKQVGRQLLDYYLQGAKTNREYCKSQYLQMINDYCHLYYVNKTVKLHSQYAPECPIYYFINELVREEEVLNELHVLNFIGSCTTIHPLSFSTMPGNSNRDFVLKRKRIVKLWTNFAKYGNPTPHVDDPLLQITWDPVENENKLSFLRIGCDLTKGRNPFQHRMEFWDDLHRDNLVLRMMVYCNDIGVGIGIPGQSTNLYSN